MLGAIKGISRCAGLYKIGRTSVPSNMLILRDSVASRGVIPPTVAAAVAIAMMVVRSDGYDVWYWSLVGYIVNMQMLENSIARRGVFSPAVCLRLSWMVRSRSPSSCAFSCIHCFAFISRDVAFRLRCRRHEFLVARLLCCRCLDLSSSSLAGRGLHFFRFLSICCLVNGLPCFNSQAMGQTLHGVHLHEWYSPIGASSQC